MGYYYYSNRLLMAASRRLMTTSTPLLLRHLRSLSTAAISRHSSPWLMLPSSAVADTSTPDSKVRSMDYSFYRLSDKQTISLHNKHNNTNPISPDSYCIGSSNGWLLYCDPRDYTLFLTNPLVSPSPPTIPLPPVTTLSNIRVVKNKIKPGGGLFLRLEKMMYNYRLEDMYFRITNRFSISGSPDSKDSVIMIIQFDTNRPAFCKPALNMDTWTNLDSPIGLHRAIYEIVYSSKEQLFYTVHEDGHIATWDFSGDNLKPHVKTYKPTFDDPEFEFGGPEQVQVLVESCGDILLVTWYYSKDFDRDGNSLHENEEDCNNPDLPYKTHGFCVFKLNEAKDLWEEMESLGDRVVFVGKNEPFSLSATDFPELKGNSVYFAAPCREEEWHVAEDWGIYNLEEDNITCHYPCSYWSKLRPPPIWIDRIISTTNEV